MTACVLDHSRTCRVQKRALLYASIFQLVYGSLIAKAATRDISLCHTQITTFGSAINSFENQVPLRVAISTSMKSVQSEHNFGST